VVVGGEEERRAMAYEEVESQLTGLKLEDRPGVYCPYQTEKRIGERSLIRIGVESHRDELRNNRPAVTGRRLPMNTAKFMT